MTDYKLVPVEPTDDELLAWAGEEQFFLFCDKDDFLQIARAVMQRYAGRSPDVQGEPVAWLVTGPYEKAAFAYKETAENYCAGPNKGYGEEAYKIRELYAHPQPAPGVSALVEALKDVIRAAPSRGPLWHGSEQIVEARAALAAHRKQQETSHDNQ